jgi:uncharacterized protein involved in exopolysaccharide biosynthesis
MESRDPDVFDIAAALWARRVLIALVTAGTAAAALLISLVLPREYRSASELLVVRPSPREGVFVRPQDVPIRTIERVFLNRDAAAAVTGELELTSRRGPMEPDELLRRTRMRLLSDMSVIELEVLMPDAAAARAVNERIVARGLEQYRTLLRADAADSAAHLDAPIREARASVAEAAEQLKAFLTTARIESLDARVRELRARTAAASSRDASALAEAEALYHERLAERTRLESELDARRAQYEELHRQRAEVTASTRFTRFDLRPLSSASLPRAPARPRARLNALAGGGLGFAAAAVWVMASAYRRRRSLDVVGAA